MTVNFYFIITRSSPKGINYSKEISLTFEKKIKKVTKITESQKVSYTLFGVTYTPHYIQETFLEMVY